MNKLGNKLYVVGLLLFIAMNIAAANDFIYARALILSTGIYWVAVVFLYIAGTFDESASEPISEGTYKVMIPKGEEQAICKTKEGKQLLNPCELCPLAYTPKCVGPGGEA